MVPPKAVPNVDAMFQTKDVNKEVEAKDMNQTAVGRILVAGFGIRARENQSRIQHLALQSIGK